MSARASTLLGAVAAAAVVVGGASASRAADTGGQFAIDGIGAVRCAQFVGDVEAGHRRVSEYGGWVTGYLTALNRFGDATFDLTPWQGTQLLVLALVTYCQQNGDLPFHQAVTNLGDSLTRDRLSARSEIVPVEQDGKRVLIYVEVVRRLQQQLKDLGYAIATIDGDFGPNTAAALKEFQTAQGLEATGLPDQPTLNQLFYVAPRKAN